MGSCSSKCAGTDWGDVFRKETTEYVSEKETFQGVGVELGRNYIIPLWRKDFLAPSSDALQLRRHVIENP